MFYVFIFPRILRELSSVLSTTLQLLLCSSLLATRQSHLTFELLRIFCGRASLPISSEYSFAFVQEGYVHEVVLKMV